MLSLPAPVVMLLANTEPVTESAEPTAVASRFSKFVTLTVSPVVWSTLVATAKLTAVVPPEAASTSVSMPVLPSIVLSVPR